MSIKCGYIKDKITKAQIAKEDSTTDKYNVEALTTFIKTILADLGETYKRSSIKQLKVLLGSMYPDGISWDYSGTLNPSISPLYQYIRDFSEHSAPLGAGEGDRTPYVHFGKVTFYR